MPTLKVKGQLRHRFFGDYSAKIGLKFESEQQAKAALPLIKARLPEPMEMVREADGRLNYGGIFESNNDQVLLLMVASQDMNAVKALLSSWGADPEAIDSVATSIDFGQPFTCEIPLDAVEPEATLEACDQQ